jgi:hypothetical protein
VKAQLFVWSSDGKIVTVDLEALVFRKAIPLSPSHPSPSLPLSSSSTTNTTSAPPSSNSTTTSSSLSLSLSWFGGRATESASSSTTSGGLAGSGGGIQRERERKATGSVTEVVDEEVVEILQEIAERGYQILYFTSSLSLSLSPSKDYLAKIKTSKGLSLPPGPIFKSPDSLLRAFGLDKEREREKEKSSMSISLESVFKASALRGVRSLFPTSHNPFHASFLSRSLDVLAFERNHFPPGRIFVLNEQSLSPSTSTSTSTSSVSLPYQPQTVRTLKLTNRQGSLSFPEVKSMINEIFPNLKGKCVSLISLCL